MTGPRNRERRWLVTATVVIAYDSEEEARQAWGDGVQAIDLGRNGYVEGAQIVGYMVSEYPIEVGA